ncbi:hypothetical protein JCM10599A_01150 [Paraburkholderia kururiensis]
MALKLGQQGFGREAKYPGIPQVVSVRYEFLRNAQFRLFDESDDFMDRVGSGQRMGFVLDIAVTRFGAGGPDAKGDKLSFPRRACSVFYRDTECSLVLDQLVGRHDKHNGVCAVFFPHYLGSYANRRRSVAR